MQPDLDRLLRESRAALPDPDAAVGRKRIALLVAQFERGTRRRGAAAAFLAVLLGLLAASLAVAADRGILGGDRPAPAAASRIVDRTVLCEIAFAGGGVYVARLNTASATRGPSVDLTTMLVPTWRLAYIGRREVALSPDCRRSTRRVPLTSRGLAGGVADQFGEEFACWTPRRVLVRVRAVFRSPVTLRRGTPYRFPLLFARGNVEQAALVVRTPAGKPVAYASVDSRTARARVFTSRRDCFPD